MLVALFRAVVALSLPELRRIVGLSLGLAVASFVVLWVAVGFALHTGARFAWWPLDWAVEVLGALAVLVVSWLLFPAVLTMVMGFFLDRVAGVVETRDYPGRGPPRHALLRETVLMTLRLMGLTIIVNLLALPVYLLAPGINFFVFLGLNGYLFGREYFEVVALRRLDATAVRAWRARFAGRVFLGGAVIAGLFAVPLVNLIVPVLATAFMVHLVEGMRRANPQHLVS
ncbi:MAG TPA: EI24 domain-containing protein [Stellaceae bacterium]|nr:EI24 domain-containing protein [Stellaceae bacterium]